MMWSTRHGEEQSLSTMNTLRSEMGRIWTEKVAYRFVNLLCNITADDKNARINCCLIFLLTLRTQKVLDLHQCEINK